MEEIIAVLVAGALLGGLAGKEAAKVEKNGWDSFKEEVLFTPLGVASLIVIVMVVIGVMFAL
jgi:hypothetical protein